MSSKKDENESIRVRTLIRAKPKQCYLNAFRVIQQVREYARADYVEGMAVVSGGLAIEHGWVEKDGVIVDPTLPSAELIYFPGLRFHGEPGLAKAIGIPKPEYTEDLPFFYRFGWGGIESPEFRAALIAAYRFVGCEALAQQYERYTPKPLSKEPSLVTP